MGRRGLRHVVVVVKEGLHSPKKDARQYYKKYQEGNEKPPRQPQNVSPFFPGDRSQLPFIHNLLLWRQKMAPPAEGEAREAAFPRAA